jgi:uncharacterized short protein YbdD (DUF466 family)
MAIATLQRLERVSRKMHSIGRAQKFLHRLWQGLRDWCGDSAYERYLRATTKRQMQRPPLSEKKFYVEQLERRYSRPNRCC